MMDVTCKQDLIDYVNRGNQVDYLFFWGHKSDRQTITKSCFSQWYNASFELDGIRYKTAEHFMMAEKARLFQDKNILGKIIAAGHPGEAKKLGRLVKGFQQDIWENKRSAVVIKGNLGKFQQNPQLQEFLINTKDKILVEASPRDWIWGIGLSQDDPDALNPNRWRGLNLLGFALMEVRNILRN